MDIHAIGLADLRGAMSVIPQESTMFLGTVRFNIDPAEVHTDDKVSRIRAISVHDEWEMRARERERKIDRMERIEMLLTRTRKPCYTHTAPLLPTPFLFPCFLFLAAHLCSKIWEAIRLVGLKSVVGSMPGKLDTHIAEDGSNLSQGQRQLFCVARAILRRSKIVLLDEATASVDVESDTNLQRVLRTVFQGCTMLTIAHRIHTISDSDRILVFDKGRVAEFDPPEALMKRPESIYRSLVMQTTKTSREGVGGTE